MDVNLREKLRKFGMEFFQHYYSSYRGVVADNKDPNKAGRVMLKIPAIYGEDVHEYWALPKAILNGNNEGQFWIPDVGTNVWVTFENGNARFPMWEHGVWGDINKFGNSVVASLYESDGSPKKKMWITASGNTFMLDDSNQTITILQKNSGNKLTIDSHGFIVNGGTEPFILGNKFKDMFKNFIQTVSESTVGSSGGPLLNAVEIAAYMDQVELFLSTICFLDK